MHSQADAEQADLAIERAELKADDRGEHKELMAIYAARGRVRFRLRWHRPVVSLLEQPCLSWSLP